MIYTCDQTVRQSSFIHKCCLHYLVLVRPSELQFFFANHWKYQWWLKKTPGNQINLWNCSVCKTHLTLPPSLTSTNMDAIVRFCRVAYTVKWALIKSGSKCTVRSFIIRWLPAEVCSASLLFTREKGLIQWASDLFSSRTEELNNNEGNFHQLPGT